MLSYPDYTRCPINIVSSIRKYYKTSSPYPSLPKLDAELEKNYKNVVLMVLDGLGMTMLERNLSASGFLRKRCVDSLTSVFPSTTAAAMTSYYTGVSPNQHGWLGWSLYFKEFCRTIDVFPNVDSYTKVAVSKVNAAEFVMPYETIFADISASILGNMAVYTVTPSDITIRGKGKIGKYADNFEQVCDSLRAICAEPKNTFTYVQWSSPDDTAHKEGCFSEKTAEKISAISVQLEKLAAKLTDTLIIVSSDHGMIDIADDIMINHIPQIADCLVVPPFVESRAAACYVKYDRRTDFERACHTYLGNDFILMPRSEVIAKGLLGGGEPHPKTLDFIADYMLCAIGNVCIRYQTLNAKPKTQHSANHGGLTDEEMIIPLIVVPTKRTREYRKKLL